MSALLQARNLTVSIGGRTLLEDVSIDAFPGEVLGLIGPNGAGKSTLLAALSGDLKPDAGEIRVCGLNPQQASQLDLARRRSVMLQDVSVSFAFLVRDVVAMGRRPWSRTRWDEQDEVLIDAALDATAVSHLAERDIMTLSGGERARVALSRVLCATNACGFIRRANSSLRYWAPRTGPGARAGDGPRGCRGGGCIARSQCRCCIL